MMNWQKITKKKPNKLLFHSSLLGILVLSLSSYFLSNIAQGKSTFDVGYIGIFTMAQYSLMGLMMLLAWRSSPNSGDISDFKSLLVVAVLVRLVLLGVTPYTSNDVDRYLFDGRIAVEGMDPYRISHDAPQLEVLREQWQPPAEHAKYVTLYPPVALALFAIASSTGHEYAVITWKLMLLTASIATLLLMVKVLINAKKIQHLALIALSPLLILESGLGLHLDTFSALAIAGILYCWQQHKVLLTGVVIGIGMLLKALPLMMLLPLIFTVKRLKHAVGLVLAAIVTVVGVYAITFSLGLVPIGSVGVFFEKWRFAAPLFTLLDTMFEAKSIVVIMLLLAVFTCSILAYIAWEARKISTEHAVFFGIMQLSVALPLLISPVVFPWYLMPLVPLIALSPNRYLIGWTLAMPLTYEVLGSFLSQQVWSPQSWPIWLIGLIQVTCLLALFKYFYRHVKSFKPENIKFMQ